MEIVVRGGTKQPLVVFWFVDSTASLWKSCSFTDQCSVLALGVEGKVWIVALNIHDISASCVSASHANLSLNYVAVIGPRHVGLAVIVRSSE